MPVAKKYTRISASQKYGTAASRVVAGTNESSQVPGRQPTKAPRPTPMIAARIVAIPTRAIVHGSELAMTSVTGAGK